MASDRIAALERQNKRGNITGQTVISAEIEVIKQLLPYCAETRLFELDSARPRVPGLGARTAGLSRPSRLAEPAGRLAVLEGADRV